MTRDDIAHLMNDTAPRLSGWGTEAHFQNFAALVISHHVKETRPEVSDSMEKWLQQIAYQHGGIGDLSKTEMEFGAMVAAAEREACAAFLESGVDLAGLAGDPMMQAFTGKLLIGCAAAIRNRGTA